MDKSAPFFLINETELLESHRLNEIDIFQAKIDIYGKPLEFHIGATHNPARLSDIVPLAYSISDRLSSAILNHLDAKNQKVPCHKGCSSCCNYLVALSLPEVFYLQEETLKMNDKHRNQLLWDCCDSANKILDLETLEKYNLTENIEMPQVSNWYSELGLSCPFGTVKIVSHFLL